MKFIPHTYQKMAIQKICDTPRAGLFLDMGLGKTVITLTAIDELMYNRFEIERVLVIAPLRVAEDTWSRESSKWDHLKHLRIAKIWAHRPSGAGLWRQMQIFILLTVKTWSG